MPNYRYPSEPLAFWMTISLVLFVILFTSAATFCLSGLFILLMIGFAYTQNRAHHQVLMEEAMCVNPQTSPELYELLQDCQDWRSDAAAAQRRLLVEFEQSRGIPSDAGADGAR